MAFAGGAVAVGRGGATVTSGTGALILRKSAVSKLILHPQQVGRRKRTQVLPEFGVRNQGRCPRRVFGTQTHRYRFRRWSGFCWTKAGDAFYGFEGLHILGGVMQKRGKVAGDSGLTGRGYTQCRQCHARGEGRLVGRLAAVEDVGANAQRAGA